MSKVLVGVRGGTVGEVTAVEGIAGGRHGLLLRLLLWLLLLLLLLPPLRRRALLLKVPGASVKSLIGSRVGIGEQVIKRVQLGPGEHVVLLAGVVFIEMHVIGGHGGRGLCFAGEAKSQRRSLN